MNVSIADKKQEAVARMKALGVFPQTIEQFKEDGYVSISESPFGAFYWAEGDDLKRIKQFESEHDALIYLAIRSYTTIGQMDSFLFVSDYPEEWEMDRDDIKHQQVLAYVYNHDAPENSEIGAIGIQRTLAAGLCRTW